MDAGNMLKPMLARGELRTGRRDDAGRVPHPHREGPRPGAPVPAGLWSVSRPSRTPSASCAGSRVATRRTTRSRSPTRLWSRRRRCPTATSPRASCRTRRSTSSTRPRPGCGWRSTARPVEIDELQRAVDRHAHGGARPRRETTTSPVAGWPSGCAARSPTGSEELSTRSTRGGSARRAASTGSATSRASSRRCSTQVEKAQRNGDFETASRLLYADIPAAESASSTRPRRTESASHERRRRWSRKRSAPTTSPMSSPPGPASRPAGCSRARRPSCCAWRGPVGSSVVVGQSSEAVTCRPTRCGGLGPVSADPDRPTGSFLFLGPTGVGKTELAKALAGLSCSTTTGRWSAST